MVVLVVIVIKQRSLGACRDAKSSTNEGHDNTEEDEDFEEHINVALLTQR